MIATAKGAPEAIAGLCHMDARGAQAVTSQVNQMAEKGLRVLGLAWPRLQDLPEAQARFRLSLFGVGGIGRPAAGAGSGGSGGVPGGGDQGGDDHRRLSGHGAQHCCRSRAGGGPGDHRA